MYQKELELLNKWVDALRSGGYQQGKHRLRSGEKGNYRYCCLGVLCDITDPNDWDDFGAWRGSYDNLPVTNPLYVIISRGDWQIDPPVERNNMVYHNLTSINDYASLTFSEIADIIEDQFIKKISRF